MLDVFIIGAGSVGMVTMRFLGPVVFHTDALMHRIRDVVEEVKIAYRKSPISEDHGGSHGPTAGERAPDATVVTLSNRATVRLFQVLNGQEWNLLLFAGRNPDTNTENHLKHLANQITTQYSQVVRVHYVNIL
ncbi:hypothetical protein NIES4071_73090 [Calothrix sp. NIES-4071]|nr:hypothetical protein NIES4071_73090 [Calothrix sp. NIES-4071]BAZ61584.1 hypothetical protein NIES4105_73040 [Calothrix sp. NIES-4105]